MTTQGVRAGELRFVVLAAPTARSQAYVQALAASALKPLCVLRYATGDGHRSAAFDAEHNGVPGAGGLVHGVPAASARNDAPLLPDLSRPLLETCEGAGWSTRSLAADSVNAPETLAALRELQPALVVFSGLPGEIVSAETLGCGVPFLHLHCGWLPDYRGSTTIYYQMLERRECAVSALYLSPEIDQGVIVERRRYRLPAADLDVDRVYDSALRADLLVRVLHAMQAGTLPPTMPQQADQGRTFHVIHPVLKHLALLSLARRPEAS
jgi:methionyl-tRNA formyltransferase